MQDYKDYEEEVGAEEESEPQHYFCKLTFGQFFTLMVLEIITLCFVFYLGARYGNEYLKLDVISESEKEPVTIVGERVAPANPEDAELHEMARDALAGEKVDLKQRVQDILARQQGPTTPPMGETVGVETGYNTEVGYQQPAQPLQQTPAAENQPSSAEFARQLQQLQQLQQAQPPAAAGAAVENTMAANTDTQQIKTFEPSPRPDTPQTEQMVKVKSTGSADFSVQVGSYPDVKEASYRVEEWKSRGYQAYLMIADLGSKGQWYRVRIGAFANKDEAERYLTDMKGREGVTDAFVVKNEQ